MSPTTDHVHVAPTEAGDFWEEFGFLTLVVLALLFVDIFLRFRLGFYGILKFVGACL